jgi:hypothetical protein
MTEIIDNNTQSLGYESPRAEILVLELGSRVLDESFPEGQEMPD